MNENLNILNGNGKKRNDFFLTCLPLYMMYLYEKDKWKKIYLSNASFYYDVFKGNIMVFYSHECMIKKPFEINNMLKKIVNNQKVDKLIEIYVINEIFCIEILLGDILERD